MAGKSKHGYSIRQKPTNEWEILACDQDGKEFWYGNFTMKQNAVRWGDSHKIEGRYPKVVECKDDPYGISAKAGIQQQAAADPVNRTFQQLCNSCGIDQESLQEILEFTGQAETMLHSVVDPASGKTIWQPNA